LSKRYHIVVIGAGAGGLVTAAGAAAVGARVALVEKNRLGGECLWTGCVPSKAYLKAARVANQVRTASRYGVRVPTDLVVDFEGVVQHMRDVQGAIEHHDDPERFRQLGVDVIEGEAFIEGPHSVRVGDRRLETRAIVVATGSRTRIPPIAGLEDVEWIDHEGIFQIEKHPESMIVLGGGPIGIEQAQVFQRLGTKVSVVELGDRILPRDDPETSEVITDQLTSEGVRFYTKHHPIKVRRQNGEIRLTMEASDGTRTEVGADMLFLATGRQPNVDGFGLQSLGVRIERDGIWTDDYLRTSVKSIYAVGDVNGKYLFTHVAEAEAKKVLRSILSPKKQKMDYTAVGWATYTDPEAAHIGSYEADARRDLGNGLVIGRYDFDQLDRALIDGHGKGFIKIYSDRRGRIYGADVVGPSAGELIQYIGLAMREGIRLPVFCDLVRLYPTLTAGVHRAADHYLGQTFSGSLLQRFLRWWLEKIWR
jgi:pyruvate/2-oxoglutarate dehydrogenase complex dihydrolipoamide dehydrogenase (E3) component